MFCAANHELSLARARRRSGSSPTSASTRRPAEVKHTYEMAVAAAMKRLGNDIVPKKVANFRKLI